MGNEETLNTTTNRSTYNKCNLFKQDHWSSRERNRRRRQHYTRIVYDVTTSYGYNLIDNIRVSRDVAFSYIHQLNYGIEWEWRTDYKHTVTRDKRPNWKLSNKCKHQWQTNRLKKDNHFNLRNYIEYAVYEW